MTAKKFIKRAQALSNVMTSTKGVTVTVSGNGAYRVPGRINVPNGDFTDADWVSMIHGWIDHELGHEEHTEHSVFIAAAYISPVLKGMLNCIEDIRMEKKVGENFVGAKKNLTRLAELAIERELFIDPRVLIDPSPLKVLSCFCLYYGRYKVIGQSCLHDYAEKAFSMLADLLSDEIATKVKILVESVNQANDTQDAFDIAKSILKLLEDELEDESSDSDDDGDSSDSDDDSESSDSDDDGDSSDSESNKDIIKSILSSDEEIKDFHEQLAESIVSIANESEYDSSVTFDNVIRCKDDFTNANAIDINLAKKMSGGLYRVLQKTLFDQAATSTTFKKTGKRLEKRKLSGVSQGRFNVFKHKSEQRDISAAVSVLVDVSTSMTWDRMRNANTSALALTKALDKSGVKVEVATFGRHDGANYMNGIIKSFDEKRVKDSDFAVKSCGGTPTGDAMARAIFDIAIRPEGNKILFVLTDGEPNCCNTVVKAKNIAHELNIKVIPIGLDVSRVGGFDKDEVIFCENESDIVKAVKDGVQRKLFN